MPKAQATSSSSTANDIHPAFAADDDERSARAGDALRDAAPEDPFRATPESMSLSEFENMLANDFEDVALPNPPAMEGWHLCWLTTTSQYDSMQKRARLGYEPVKQSELPSFTVGNTGVSDGLIRCNEMLLCKISSDRYQAIMSYYHHKRPLQDEQSAFELLKQAAESRGAGAPGGRVGEQEKGMLGELQQELQTAASRRPVFN